MGGKVIAKASYREASYSDGNDSNKLLLKQNGMLFLPITTNHPQSALSTISFAIGLV